ncbi:ankyrin repeat-containing domain protein [Xylaria telfairii]|nr:ankyrin repeat-containing domain protein [Xylaria telfairii]
MTTQLSFDILRLIAKDILAQAGFKDVFNISLVSKAVHDFTYPSILKANASQNHAFIGPPRGHINAWVSHINSTHIPQSLRFFIKKDNAELVGLLLNCVGADHNAACYITTDYEPVLWHAIQGGAVSVVEFLLRAGASLSCGNKHEIPLRLAIDTGSVIMTRFLLEHLRLRGQQYNNLRLIQHARRYIESRCMYPSYSSEGHLMAKTLLQYCSDVNEKDEHGYTILHQFVHDVRLCGTYDESGTYDEIRDIVSLLVQAGVDINALTPGGAICGMWIRRTALDYASMYVMPNLIRALLQNGASAQGALAFDFTGPTVVSFKASIEGVPNFRRRMARSYGPPTNESQVPLIYAAATPLHALLYNLHINEGHPEKSDIGRYRLGWEDPIEKSVPVCERGWQPWLGWSNNVCESAKLLINHGLVQPQGIFDTSHKILVSIEAICAELRVDWPELWSLLLKGDVLNVHHRNEFGQTFLNQLASGCCGKTIIRAPSWKPNLVRALVLGGSDLNTIDNSGMTPLHWAILHGNFDLVKLLVELGANPAQEVNGSTPTHYAFGKRFPRRGPVAKKVMASLRKQLTNVIRRTQIIHRSEPDRHPYTKETERFEAFCQYRKCQWHPLLSICSDSSFKGDKYKALVNDAHRRMFSIMALLLPFETISGDENGNTPRHIAENEGLLKGGESLVLHPERLHVQEGYDEQEPYSSHWDELRFKGKCYDHYCHFCSLFPRPLLDLDTDSSCPTVLTNIMKDGQIVYSGISRSLD